MAQVLIRNLDDATVATLKLRAAARGHSLEHELRLILAEAARPAPGERRERAAEIRQMSSHPVERDLELLIREDRER